MIVSETASHFRNHALAARLGVSLAPSISARTAAKTAWNMVSVSTPVFVL
jgi:hypothetical protein